MEGLKKAPFSTGIVKMWDLSSGAGFRAGDESPCIGTCEHISSPTASQLNQRINLRFESAPFPRMAYPHHEKTNLVFKHL